MARWVPGWLRSHRDMGRVGGPRQHRVGRGPRFARLAIVAALLAPWPAAAEPTGPVRLVALGDSLTAGYRLPAAAAFPTVLERMLAERGMAVTVANAGVSGDTSSAGLERVDWSVPDGTEGVILELGANDMLRGLAPSVTAAALAGIVERLRARGIPVLLAGMVAAPNLGPDYRARFDAIYPDLARRYGLTLYPFFLEGIVGDRALHLDDGLHPNALGVEAVAARMLPTVAAFVDGLRRGAPGTRASGTRAPGTGAPK